MPHRDSIPPALAPSESPVQPGTHADREGLDGLQYVTGVVPDQSFDDFFRAEEDAAARAAEDAAGADEGEDGEDASDPDGPGDPNLVLVADLGLDLDGEFDAEEAGEDVDAQGRAGSVDQDWQGQGAADGGRKRPSDGSRVRR